MKKLTRPQTATAIVAAAVVIGGSVYAYTENKKAYEHEQRCLSVESEIVKLGREKKEVGDQLDQLIVNDDSDYAKILYMQNEARIAELMAREKSLREQLIGDSGWFPVLKNECGAPRAAKVVETNPSLFPHQKLGL
jgi:hypothetical protein